MISQITYLLLRSSLKLIEINPDIKKMTFESAKKIEDTLLTGLLEGKMEIENTNKIKVIPREYVPYTCNDIEISYV